MAKRARKEAKSNIAGPETTDSKFLALMQEIKSLVSPISAVEKLLSAGGNSKKELHWPRIILALEAAKGVWQANREEIARKLEDGIRIADELRTQQLSGLEHKFRKEVERHGWSLNGSWPEPVVEEIIFIKVIPEVGKIIINDRTIPWCHVEEIVAEIEKERADLSKDTLDPSKWLSEVCRAYDKALVKLGLPKGEPVPVFDVLAQLVWGRHDHRILADPSQENFKAYSAKEFRADLTRALASGITTTADGRRLDISAGSFSRQTIFMYFPSTRHLGSCGRIAFSPSGNP
jgi:hypothetical protein